MMEQTVVYKVGDASGSRSVIDVGDVRYFQEEGIEFEDDAFGSVLDKKSGQVKPVRRFTWRNDKKVTIQAITYGATITSIKVPNKSGNVEDIVCGFNDIAGYQHPLNPYFGATVGRVANRIGNSRFIINGNVYNVTDNIKPHHLHGGKIGFDKVNWEYHIEGSKVVMSYHSDDNEEGFPGDLVVNVSFQLNRDSEFKIDFKAYTTKPTYVNLTNHSYFNLAGESKGAEEVYKHCITMNADKITEVDNSSIPTGNLLPVAGTIFDLRIPKVLGDLINQVPNSDGYDHNFCVTKASKQEDTFVARAVHPPSGRVMEIYSNQPGVQFYTSNFFPENPSKFKGDPTQLQTLPGKQGNYYKHGAFCFETQNYPDAINHDNFPPAVLYPGKTYHHTVTYKFLVEK